MQQLILGTGTAIWWLTEPHLLTVIILSIVMLSFNMLSEVMLSFMVFRDYPKRHKALYQHTINALCEIMINAVFHYFECDNAERHNADCQNKEFHNIKCCNAVIQNA